MFMQKQDVSFFRYRLKYFDAYQSNVNYIGDARVFKVFYMYLSSKIGNK